MELTRVELHNWPDPPYTPGGWVAPHGNPIDRWVVIAVHAWYVAPRRSFDERDEHGRALGPRPELHAYLVDLDGSHFGLESFDNVVLHQKPPTQQWFVRSADAEYLATIERWRRG